MALNVNPDDEFKLEKGEDVAYRINLNPELDGDTIDTHTFKIYDDDNEEVTSNFSGGSSDSAGYITFGIIAHETGEYTIQIWTTCKEMLPNTTTPKKFLVELTITVE